MTALEAVLRRVAGNMVSCPELEAAVAELAALHPSAPASTPVSQADIEKMVQDAVAQLVPASLSAELQKLATKA